MKIKKVKGKYQIINKGVVLATINNKWDAIRLLKRYKDNRPVEEIIEEIKKDPLIKALTPKNNLTLWKQAFKLRRKYLEKNKPIPRNLIDLNYILFMRNEF